MDITIFHADVFAGIKHLQNNSIDIAITSPPYWGQRDYGFEGQIGCEISEDEYISKLTFIFNELKNKISDKGIFFLNIGDKYLKKYGKTPLGFIPFRLAHEMIKTGWLLNEIIIWFKPNHMPSSIKNRFANSYEPVFVFSKNEENLYSIKNPIYKRENRVLKVNLQSTKYKHIAVYPEQLVEQLLNLCYLNEDGLSILDPFAGSGTTLKSAMSLLKKKNNKYFLIEKNSQYIDIILERCNLDKELVKIHQISDIKYDYDLYRINNHQLTLFDNQISYTSSNSVVFNYENNNGFIKIFSKETQLMGFLNDKFKSNIIKSIYSPQSVFFVGCKEFSLNIFMHIHDLSKYGWITRNIIIVENKNNHSSDKSSWFPIFMIVDDNKKFDYVFNYQNLFIKQKHDYSVNYKQKNFIGYKVKNNFDKESTGIIVDILQKRTNGLPLYVAVLWDDQTITKEYVIEFEEDVLQNIIYVNKYTILEKEEIIPIDNKIENEYVELKKIQNNGMSQKRSYNGKFISEKKINFGASPGARQSVSEEYFYVKRLYNIPQRFIADYLNHKRMIKNLSKKQLTDLFPKSYKHTVGHWIRNDFGGSIPKPKDWIKLQSILDIEENFIKIICKRALKLQTVKPSKYKVPDDFLPIEQLDNLKKILEPLTTPHLHNDITCGV